MEDQLKTVFTRRGAALSLPRLAVPIDEAATMVGVSYNTLWRSIREDQFPGVRIRDRIVIPVRALDELFDANESTDTALPSPIRLAVAINEAAVMISVARVTLRRAISENQFPAIRIRERIVIPIKAVSLLLDAAVAAGGLIDAAAWTAEWLDGTAQLAAA